MNRRCVNALFAACVILPAAALGSAAAADGTYRDLLAALRDCDVLDQRQYDDLLDALEEAGDGDEPGADGVEGVLYNAWDYELGVDFADAEGDVAGDDDPEILQSAPRSTSSEGLEGSLTESAKSGSESNKFRNRQQRLSGPDRPRQSSRLSRAAAR